MLVVGLVVLGRVLVVMLLQPLVMLPHGLALCHLPPLPHPRSSLVSLLLSLVVVLVVCMCQPSVPRWSIVVMLLPSKMMTMTWSMVMMSMVLVIVVVSVVLQPVLVP